MEIMKLTKPKKVDYKRTTGTLPAGVRKYLPKRGMDEIRQEIKNGLLARVRTVPSKYFYDSAGSILFEKITRLEEYYLSRTEKEILSINLPSVAGESRFDCVVELGNGDCSKISLLFGSMPAARLKRIKYMPVDISESAIEESLRKLRERFGELQAEGIVADFMTQMRFVPVDNGYTALYCFFGSTLGNFEPLQRREFFNTMAGIMKEGESLLLGADMVKDARVVENAYNDSQGITALFNKNILNSVNYYLHSDFDVRNFQHLAFYNENHERIEMHLVALDNMEISSPYFDEPLLIKKGEALHTENSYKFRRDAIVKLCNDNGLELEDTWTDSKNWFSVFRITRKPAIGGNGQPR
jgi:L-histidine Nalpha-methyltransferase